MGAMKTIIRTLTFCLAGLLPMWLSQISYAGDLEWSGLYRIEGQSFDNPLLDRSFAVRKEYANHILILRGNLLVKKQRIERSSVMNTGMLAVCIIRAAILCRLHELHR